MERQPRSGVVLSFKHAVQSDSSVQPVGSANFCKDLTDNLIRKVSQNRFSERILIQLRIRSQVAIKRHPEGRSPLSPA